MSMKHLETQLEHEGRRKMGRVIGSPSGGGTYNIHRVRRMGENS